MGRVLFVGDDPLNLEIQALLPAGWTHDLAPGGAAAVAAVRRRGYVAVVTSVATSLDEDLALVDELRRVRPGVATLLLAAEGSPEQVIAALRARVFACFVAPIAPGEVASMIVRAAEDDWWTGIEIVAAQPNWISLRADCRRLTAERLTRFLGEFRSADLGGGERDDLLLAIREILLNAAEHGCDFRADHVLQIWAVRTARAIFVYVHDPGPGFRPDDVPHAAVGNPPDDPLAHVERRAEAGLRPGGFGMLLARNIVDELIYGEHGNEVLLIKHLS